MIAGHSLGAGVAGMLALVGSIYCNTVLLLTPLQMWADPRTCLTHRQSGFPLNRHVSAYCYAPPCLTDAPLSKLTAQSGLITSFVYSHDVVSRLSLGSIRDLQRACTFSGTPALMPGPRLQSRKGNQPRSMVEDESLINRALDIHALTGVMGAFVMDAFERLNLW